MLIATPPLELLQTRLAAGVEQLGLSFTGGQLNALLDYLLLLTQWNQHYNLTAVRDPVDMITRHLLDSLAALPYLQSGNALDLGTGAGLPGIPLAIARPDVQWVLLDSAGKKTRFVRHVIQTLQLTQVTVIQARIENYTPAVYFQTITARAFTNLTALYHWSVPLGTPNAHLLVFKGRYPTEELAALPATVHYHVHRLVIPDLIGERHLIDIRCSPRHAE